MIRSDLSQMLRRIVLSLANRGAIPQATYPMPEVTDTKSPEHGHFASNFALVASKSAGANPRELGAMIAEELLRNAEGADTFEKIELAGPGFLNMSLKPEFVSRYVGRALADPLAFLHPPAPPQAKHVNVEFVSVNPNGPITVGSGRGAAFGSTLCNVLEAAGHSVHREYYINDGVNSEQMRLFAESVRASSRSLPPPENGYKGEYVTKVAQKLASEHGREMASSPDLAWFQDHSQRLMIEHQKRDLAQFGVSFDTWFSEQSLHDSGEVERCIKALASKGIADERPVRAKVKFAKGGQIEDVEIEPQGSSCTPGVEGDDDHAEDQEQDARPTLWLRSTKLGDDMDRVLRRSDGRLTYIASDVAYHKSKFDRGSKPDSDGNCQRADQLITVLGPDHHGYIGRLHAVLAALDLPAIDQGIKDASELRENERKLFASTSERDACHAALDQARRELQVVIFQIVRFMKDGKPAPMRKRDGNIYELRDLIIELGKSTAPGADEDEQLRIGKDVARFFYLMRSHDTAMDFDIDLATKQSDENPVFYVQYAHARICSVLRKAEAAAVTASSTPPSYEHPREIALILKISDLPWELERCAQDFGVHRLTTYAQELARSFHHFYDACRVIEPTEPERTSSRLKLCQATAEALRFVLVDLLGISAPEAMERAPGP